MQYWMNQKRGSAEISPNITAELNAKGELIGIEILGPSNFIRARSVRELRNKEGDQILSINGRWSRPLVGAIIVIRLPDERPCMSGCCDNNCSIDALREKQRGTLQIVLAINGVMFLVIMAAAFYGNSTALLADSLDNLGDALTYGLSLYVVSRGVKAKARVALFKGGLIFLASLAVVAQIVYKLFVPNAPLFEIMGAFSLIGLAANSICLFLLWRHRHDDVNMSSVWECSRNDIASNLSVFVAAGVVWLTHSGWPDIVVALGLVWLLMRSAIRVISSALVELRAVT